MKSPEQQWQTSNSIILQSKSLISIIIKNVGPFLLKFIHIILKKKVYFDAISFLKKIIEEDLNHQNYTCRNQKENTHRCLIMMVPKRLGDFYRNFFKPMGKIPVSE